MRLVARSGAWRVEPDPASPNLIGGDISNFAGVGVHGVTIAGGGEGVTTCGLSGSEPCWNRVLANYGTIGGGAGNQASSLATVGGGSTNAAVGAYAAIPGGLLNTADGWYSAVGGGSVNHAGGQHATVGGGWENEATSDEATVGGGWGNHASGTDATIPGGSGNSAAGSYSFAAGRKAKADNSGSFIWADSTDADFASTANDQFAARAGGGVRLVVGSGAWRIEPDVTSPNLIGGSAGNAVTSGMYGATIGGGGYSSSMCGAGSDPCQNRVSANFGTVSGGYANIAGASATIAGGSNNTVTGTGGTVGGGGFNTASGYIATVPGGGGNTASGDYSFAAGRRAKANHNGSFVWADSTDADVTSGANNQFVVRASGGIIMYTNSSLTYGSTLAAGSGSWSSLSDRNLKENFAEVDDGALLDRLAQVPVSTWNYKSQDPSIRHIGPVAQDFYAAFSVGEDDTHITTIDADGVVLAASQALYELAQEQAGQIAALQAENATLKANAASQQEAIASLEARMATLEVRAGGGGAPLAGRWELLGLAAAGLAVGVMLTRRGGAR